MLIYRLVFFKALLLCLSAMLTACKPLSEYDLMGSFFDRGTLLASGEYAPRDHWARQWKIVNVWAEWCQPCWQEIPELNQFYKQQNEKVLIPKGKIQLLGFNYDQLEIEELAKLKETMSIEFPVLTQWPEVWEKPEIKGLPATIIIGPNNTVKRILFGPQTLKSLNNAMSQKMEEISKPSL